MDAAHDHGILVHLFLLDRINILFEEGKHLILLKAFSSLLSDWLIERHLQEKSVVKEGADHLEVKLIGVRFTNLFTSVSEQIEEGLENTGHLNDMQKLQIQEWLLPILWLECLVFLSFMHAGIQSRSAV